MKPASEENELASGQREQEASTGWINIVTHSVKCQSQTMNQLQRIHPFIMD